MAERINTGTVGIARHPQILRVTNIRAKLDLVIALHLGDIAHALELLFTLDQRAVAATDTQPVAEIGPIAGGLTVHVELAQTRK